MLGSSHDLFFRKLDGLLSLPAGSVKGEQLLTDLPTWDSLTILEFMVLADSDYESDVQPADIAACKTVADLADMTFAQSLRSTARS